jgi:hypothetical protein
MTLQGVGVIDKMSQSDPPAYGWTTSTCFMGQWDTFLDGHLASFFIPFGINVFHDPKEWNSRGGVEECETKTTCLIYTILLHVAML